jgi:hypothetical protein
LIVGLIASVGFAAPAAASPPQERCALLAQRADDLTKTIPLKEVCGSEATRQLRASAWTLLASYHEHANYGGEYAEVYGEYGTCDRAGYKLTVPFGWSYKISSYHLYGDCYWSAAVNWNWVRRPDTIGSQSYVGDKWNDFTRTIYIWSRW